MLGAGGTTAVDQAAERHKVLSAFSRSLGREAHVLTKQADLLWQQLYNRLQWEGDALLEQLEAENARRMKREAPAWLQTRMQAPESSALRLTLAGHASEVRSCAISPDGGAIASASGGTIILWDPKTGAQRDSFEGRGPCFFSADGRQLFYRDSGTSILIREVETGQSMGGISSEGVTTFEPGPGNHTIATLHHDEAIIRLWDLTSRKEQITLRGHAAQPLAFSPDGKTIATGRYTTDTLGLWQIQGGPTRVSWSEIMNLSSHTDQVNACAFSPDGSWFLSAGRDASLRIWDTASGEQMKCFSGLFGTQTNCAISMDGKWFAATNASGQVLLWDLDQDDPLFTFEGHKNAATACAFSPDGSWLVSSSEDQTLRVWDTASGKCKRILRGHEGKVLDCAVSGDGRWIASASRDKNLILWDAVTHKPIRTIEGHSSAVSACVFGPGDQTLISSSYDTSIRIWDPLTGEQKAFLYGSLMGLVNDIAVSPDGRWVLSASLSRYNDPPALRIWEVASGKCLVTLKGHEHAIQGCAIHPEGNRVLSAGVDRTLKLWGQVPWNIPVELVKEKHIIRDCAFSPDGSWIVTAGGEPSLVIWDLDQKEIQTTLQGHTGEVTACAISADGNLIVSAGEDRNLIVWDARTGTERATLAGHSAKVTDCTISPDATWIVSASADHTLKLWSMPGEEKAIQAQRHEGIISACRFSPDGRLFATAGHDGYLKLWDAHTGKLYLDLRGHSEFVFALAFAPDSKYLVAGDHYGYLKVWDVATGAERLISYRTHGQTEGNTGSIRACTVSPDGRWIASASEDTYGYGHYLFLWDMAQEQQPRELHGYTKGVSMCAFSPDSARMVTDGTFTNEVWIWDVLSGKKLTKVQAKHTGSAGCRFSPDGQWVLSARGIFEANSGEQTANLSGDGKPADAFAVSPDGTWMVTACADEVLRLWSIPTGEPLGSLTGHADMVRSCAISSDGQFIFSAGDDRTFRVWERKSGRELSCLPAMDGALLVDAHPAQAAFAGADRAGHPYLIELRGIQYGPSIITATRDKNKITLRCPSCQGEHLVNQDQLGSQMTCLTPGCGMQLKINPFAIQSTTNNQEYVSRPEEKK